MPQTTVTHKDITDLRKKLNNGSGKEWAGEDLVFIVRPAMRVDDSAKALLRHEGIELVRDPAAPIDGCYLLDRATYNKWSKT